jgi:hypothetical protein
LELTSFDWARVLRGLEVWEQTRRTPDLPSIHLELLKAGCQDACKKSPFVASLDQEMDWFDMSGEYIGIPLPVNVSKFEGMMQVQ